jgi:hypothetical protein
MTKGRDRGSAPGKDASECKSWRWLRDKIADLFQVLCCRLFPNAPPEVKWEVGRSHPNLGIDLYRAEKPFRAEIKAACFYFVSVVSTLATFKKTTRRFQTGIAGKEFCAKAPIQRAQISTSSSRGETR